LENYICVQAFKHQPVPIDQVFCTRCVLCLLQSWRFQLTALPGISVGASKFLGVQRTFAQNFPNSPKKLSCNFCRPFSWCDLQQNGLHLFFCKLWASFFEVKQRWAPFLPNFLGILFGFSGILPKFSGILPGFSTNKIVWGYTCTPCTPAFYTTDARANHAKSAKHIVASHVFFQTRRHWR